MNDIHLSFYNTLLNKHSSDLLIYNAKRYVLAAPNVSFLEGSFVATITSPTETSLVSKIKNLRVLFDFGEENHF